MKTLTLEQIKTYYSLSPDVRPEFLKEINLSYQSFRIKCRKMGINTSSIRREVNPKPVVQKRKYGKFKQNYTKEETLAILTEIRSVHRDEREELCTKLTGVGYIRFKRVAYDRYGL